MHVSERPKNGNQRETAKDHLRLMSSGYNNYRHNMILVNGPVGDGKIKCMKIHKYQRSGSDKEPVEIFRKRPHSREHSEDMEEPHKRQKIMALDRGDYQRHTEEPLLHTIYSHKDCMKKRDLELKQMEHNSMDTFHNSYKRSHNRKSLKRKMYQSGGMTRKVSNAETQTNLGPHSAYSYSGIIDDTSLVTCSNSNEIAPFYGFSAQDNISTMTIAFPSSLTPFINIGSRDDFNF